jgi:hypothetical protein
MHFFVVFKKLHVILRLYGYKRYDSMDGGGRAMHGAIAESNAGAVADDCMDAGGRATQEQLPSKQSN